MKIGRIGERSALVSDLGGLKPAALAQSLNAKPPAGLVEAVPAPESVGLYFRSRDFNLSELESLVATIQVSELSGKSHIVPVWFGEGQDLFECCRETGLERYAFIDLLCSVELECVAVGFQPGFPYLTGLPQRLSTLPRRSSPRPRVPERSVAIAAGMAGIYPAESPGGWNLIGRTPYEIADLREGHFPISAGDRVRFEAISEGEYERLLGGRL